MATSTQSVVDEKGRLRSDLWLDQPDARERIGQRLEKGELSEDEAEKLAHFVDKGYLAIHLDVPESLIDQVNQDVERLWKEKPFDLAYAYREELTSMDDAEEEEHRQPGYRIADLHGHSQAARQLYLNEQLFHWTGLIFGKPPVAFQSLYFEWGSQQSLHRDPVYVVTTPPSHLLASWIALEDIGPDCGPLIYVPGSHKLPYYQFEKGRIAIKGGEDYMRAFKHTQRLMDKEGLEETTFTCKKGDAFIWHAHLVHGGSLVSNPNATRKSLVVHYSTLGDYTKRGGQMNKLVKQGGQFKPEPLWASTEELIEEDGRHGFKAPLKGLDPENLPLGEKIRHAIKRFLRKIKG